MPSHLYPLHLRPQTALTERVEGGLIIPNRVAVSVVPPLWGVIPDQVDDVNVAIAPFDTSAFLIEGDPPIAYTAVSLPTGLVLDIDTGIITGTPTLAGVFNVIETATNAGGFDDAPFDWTINQAADIFADLVTQADVNTGGRTDDFPYDHVLNQLATLGAGAPVVGAAGDDGQAPMSFDGAVDYIILANTAGPNSLLSGPHSICVRVRCPLTQLQVHGVPYGFGGSDNNNMRDSIQIANTGLPSYNAVNDTGTVSAAAPGSTDIENASEHVIIGTTDLVTVQIYVDGVKEFDGTITNNPLSPMTSDNHLWGVRIRGVITERWYFQDVFWTAAYDTVIGQDVIDALNATANPYEGGRPPPPPPPLEVDLASQADVNTRGRTDDAPYDHVQAVLGVAQGTAGGTAGGDGGATGSRYVGTGHHQLDLTDMSFLEADFTVACRMETDFAFNAFGMAYTDNLDTNPDGYRAAIGRGSGTNMARYKRQSNLSGLFNATTGVTMDLTERVMVFTWDVGTALMTMYIDGVEAAQFSSGTDPVLTTMFLWGAEKIDNTGSLFDGTVFWTAGWSRVLPLDQIQLLDDTVNPFL